MPTTSPCGTTANVDRALQRRRLRRRWVALRGLLTYATREAYIPANPCDALTRRERPKPGRPKTRYLTEGEIQRILARGDDQTKAINALLIFSGLRASELLGLIWQDIDFEQQLIHVTHQMSRQGKRVPLKTEAGIRDVILMDELARLLRRRKLAARFSSSEHLVIANGSAIRSVTRASVARSRPRQRPQGWPARVPTHAGTRSPAS